MNALAFKITPRHGDFPNCAGCKPKLDFLDCLKAVAERAQLDSDNSWLHKFGATFATRCLWAGKVSTVRTAAPASWSRLRFSLFSRC
jgi:hypothetical protein